MPLADALQPDRRPGVGERDVGVERPTVIFHALPDAVAVDIGPVAILAILSKVGRVIHMLQPRKTRAARGSRRTLAAGSGRGPQRRGRSQLNEGELPRRGERLPVVGRRIAFRPTLTTTGRSGERATYCGAGAPT